MSNSTQLVVFRLGGQRYGVSLFRVDRVIPAVEVTVLPQAPWIALGVINVAGTVIPVLNLRRRFGLAEKEITPEDQFLIVQTGSQTAALVIDEALGVIEHPGHEITGTAEIIPGVEQVAGLIKLQDGLVLLHDLEKILSYEEARELTAAMNEGAAHGK